MYCIALVVPDSSRGCHTNYTNYTVLNGWIIWYYTVLYRKISGLWHQYNTYLTVITYKTRAPLHGSILDWPKSNWDPALVVRAWNFPGWSPEPQLGDRKQAWVSSAEIDDKTIWWVFVLGYKLRDHRVWDILCWHSGLEGGFQHMFQLWFCVKNGHGYVHWIRDTLGISI